MKKALLQLAVVSVYGSSSQEMHGASSPQVRMQCGLVQGVLQPGGLAAFRGLPYGRAERWQPPKAARCWPNSSAFDASKDGPRCPGRGVTPDQLASGEVAEDCLNLNVFAPNNFSIRHARASCEAMVPKKDT